MTVLNSILVLSLGKIFEFNFFSESNAQKSRVVYLESGVHDAFDLIFVFSGEKDLFFMIAPLF